MTRAGQVPAGTGQMPTPGQVPAGIDQHSGPWCDRCGRQRDTGDHRECDAARTLEPPRYCPHCRRRMKVQVLPMGWTASCVEHGESRPAPDPGP